MKKTFIRFSIKFIELKEKPLRTSVDKLIFKEKAY
tara:strand:- start:7773 stop:7877 length:105 start_codon:yes stop_codon:yes gene_type:complete